MRRYKNIIGWISALLIVIAYALLSFNIVKKEDVGYNLTNLIGGIGLGYRVYLDKNYANLLLEIFFALIAIKSLLI